MNLPILTSGAQPDPDPGKGLNEPGDPSGGLINEFAPPQDLIDWAVGRFESWRVVVTTAFGMEGCALIDMLARTSKPITVTYLDTHFFFPETYALRDRLSERYPTLRFVNAGTPLTPEEQAARYAPELWKSDPDKCCMLRKVVPMWDLMKGADVWLTGIRRDQSPARADTRVVEWDWRFDVLKINPFAYWTRHQVWDYVRSNDVPYNPLHDQGYPSIGCTHCTTPVLGSEIGEYSRAGRWAGTEKKECGLHLGENI